MSDANAKPGVLRNLRIKRVALVDVGANLDRATGDGAHIMLYKRADDGDKDIDKDGPGLAAVHVDRPMGKDGDGTDPEGCPCPNCDGADIEEYEKATLDAASRAKIPDSKFLAVWTDAQGKKHRKLPVHDKGHLTAAAGRIDQAQMPADVKAAAHRKLERLTSSNKESSVAKKTIQEVLKKMSAALAEPDVTKRAAMLKEAEAEAGDLSAPPAHEGTDALHPAHVDAVKAHMASLHKAIQAFGAGPHPPGHPVHEMKAHYTKLHGMLKEAGHSVDEPGSLGELPLSKAAKDAIDAANAKATVLEKQVAALVKQGEVTEMRSILKSFKATPFNLDGEPDTNDIDKFIAMKRADAPGFDRMMELFKAADAQMAVSKAFANTGSGLSGAPGGAWEKIVAKAKNLREKSANPLTLEAAIDRVMEEDPALVAQYRQELQ